VRHRSSFAFSPLDQPAASSCAEFPFPPKGILTLGIKHPLDMTVSAFMIAIRASIGSPPRLQSIRTSIAVCHSGRSDSLFGSFVM
jgi:hypothetical protein